MARATLSFNLEKPEDVAAHKRAVKALDMALVIWDIDQYLRGKIKYDETLHQEAHDALDKARGELYDIMNKHNVDIDELLD